MLVEFKGISAFSVLVFRDAEQNTRDYLTDLETGELSLVRNKKEVHAGFAEALNSVWHEIEAATQLPEFLHGTQPGAALATLAAARDARSRGQGMTPLSCRGMFPAAERPSVVGANFNATAPGVGKAHERSR